MKNFLQNLTERERVILLFGGIAAGHLLLYLLVVMPMINSEAASLRALNSEKSRYERITQLIASYHAVDQETSVIQKSEPTSIRSAITETARQKGINISRLQPGVDGQLGVWFNDVSSGDFFVWLAILEKEYGIKAQKISLNPNGDKQSLRAQVSFREAQ